MICRQLLDTRSRSMLQFRVFGATHLRPASPPPHLCVLPDLRVEIPASLNSRYCTSRKTSPKPRQRNPFQINRLRTLPSSVYRKLFVCHSYENSRVYTNNSHSGTRRAPFASRISNLQGLTFVFSHSCGLFCTFLYSTKTQVFSFHALAHSLPKNTRGGGWVQIVN